MGREIVKIKSSKQDQHSEHFTYNERRRSYCFYSMKNIDPVPKGRGHNKIKDSRKVFYIYGTKTSI